MFLKVPRGHMAGNFWG